MQRYFFFFINALVEVEVKQFSHLKDSVFLFSQAVLLPNLTKLWPSAKFTLGVAGNQPIQPFWYEEAL